MILGHCMYVAVLSGAVHGQNQSSKEQYHIHQDQTNPRRQKNGKKEMKTSLTNLLNMPCSDPCQPSDVKTTFYL